MTVGVNPAISDDIPFRKIFEVTGIIEEAKIVNAWKSCRIMNPTASTEQLVPDVVKRLLSDNPSKQNSVRPSMQSTGTQNPTNVIDLTNEGESDDLQRAIAASLLQLQDTSEPPTMLGGQISREDRDISRVLEESLASSQPSRSKVDGVWPSDHGNPHDRLRKGSWPVGLKNVGNTCWFNAVVQSLFHIPVFRRLILTYSAPSTKHKDSLIQVFMTELRHLFALMLCSKRQYVNPTRAIDLLRQSFTQPGGAVIDSLEGQQDVSEFQHKFIDWLEEAFQSTMSTATDSRGDADRGAACADGTGNRVVPGHSGYTDPSELGVGETAMETDCGAKDKDERNYIIKLFYGKVKAYGTNDGQVFTTHTHFGQWPLGVSKYCDVHESLEAGLAQEDIETNNSEQKTAQEHWFTKLPPVLTLELSRFQYNTQLTQPEKLHNQFAFPQTLYLDRYLDDNKEEVKQCREKVSKLKAELHRVEHILNQYMAYGTDQHRYPLPDILKYALDFANSATETCGSSSVNGADRVSKDCMRPYSVTADELSTITGCLSRWHSQIVQDITCCQDRCSTLRAEIDMVYDQPHLCKYPYNLHAVLVHQGQAVSGHYWAFIYNRQHSIWLKYNDNSVLESSWEEVVRESYGGFGTASAYCLIYISVTELTDSASSGSAACNTSECPEQAFQSLPDDLKEFVLLDHRLQEEELQRWDFSQRPLTNPQEDAEEADIVMLRETEDGSYSAAEEEPAGPVDQLASEHALIMLDLLMGILKKDPQLLSPISWNDSLGKITQHCYNRFESEEKKLRNSLPKTDHRTYMPVYLLAVYKESGLRHEDVESIIVDHIARLDRSMITPYTDKLDKLKQVAWTFIKKYKMDNPHYEQLYIKWHEEFHQFRKIVSLFVDGLIHYNASRYEDALPYLHGAYTCNKLVAQSNSSQGADHSMRCLDQELIGRVRRRCLMHLNDAALQQFEQEQDFEMPLQSILKIVLPVLDSMQDTTADSNAASSIKDRWLHYGLSSNHLDNDRKNVLNEFLTQLFEPASYPVPQMLDRIKIPLNLGSKYRNAMVSLLQGNEEEEPAT